MNRVVIRAFGRITEDMAELVAKTIRSTRQLADFRREKWPTGSHGVAVLRGSIKALTMESQAMRAAFGSSRASAGSPHAPSPTGARDHAGLHDPHSTAGLPGAGRPLDVAREDSPRPLQDDASENIGGAPHAASS